MSALELPDLDRDLIREVFLRNGFTVKEGQTDLKLYVYEAAAELIALARRAQPEGEAPQAEPVSHPAHDFKPPDWANAGGGWVAPHCQVRASQPAQIEQSRNFGKPEGEAPQVEAVQHYTGGRFIRYIHAPAGSTVTYEPDNAYITIAPAAQQAESGARVWDWDRRAEAARAFLSNYADTNMEVLLDGYQVQPIIRRLAAAIQEWQLATQPQDTGLAKSALEQTQARLAQADARIAELEAAQSQGSQPLRYTSDGALAECPCCGSLDVGGAHNTVHCYTCDLTIKRVGPLQNAIDAWNRRTDRAAIAAKAEAPTPSSTEIANVILRLVGECAMDWKAGATGDPDDSFTSDAEELRVLVDLVNKARAQQAAAPGTMDDLLPTLGIRNDRDMLNYLMTAFDNEIANCERCGHAEPTKNMDSASFLRDYLAAAPSAPGTPEAPAEFVPFGRFHSRKHADGSVTTFHTRDDDPDSFVLYQRAAQLDGGRGEKP